MMSLKPKRVEFSTIWKGLQETSLTIITLSPIPRTIWNDRFTDVYTLCVAQPEPFPDRLYAETKQLLIDHVAKILYLVQEDGDSQLIKNYYKYWVEYSTGSTYLHKLFSYLNTQHIQKQKMTEAEIIYGGIDPDGGEQIEIGELALEIWRAGLIAPLAPKLVKLVLDAIAEDRRYHSTSLPVDAVRGTILSFVEVHIYRRMDQLDLYKVLFEQPFLNASGDYFKREAARLLEDKDVSLYMEKVISKIEEELCRARKFLHHSSLPKVTQRCESHMVAEHLGFLYSECMAMVQSEEKKDLSNLYSLLKSIPNASVVLVDNVLQHIKAQGLLAIGNLCGENFHIPFVENLLNVYKLYKSLIQEVFKGDQTFLGALDKACSFVINHKPNGGRISCKSPELLARYCDSLLKKSSNKSLSDSELDDKLSQSIIIFKYIDDKDVFQKFYSRMLAKRLIHSLTISMDAEESMITKLKQACGYEFTNKLHRMFTDMSVSADLNKKFDIFLTDENITLGIDFHVYVLQAGAWPLGQAIVSNFAVPLQLVKSVNMFESFYHTKFSGRKITWLHHLCHAELRLGYLKKPYVITMQTFQMAILLMFEENDTVTCTDIRETLQLSADQFQRHAASLVDSKLLLTNSQDYQVDTVLRLNMDYANKRTRLKIVAAVQKETPQEIEHTMNSVEEDRKLFIQAAIVRIMKSRKVLKHNNLIQEVCSLAKASFAPNIPMIKKSIETLIEKQYIERTPHSPEEYSYIA